MIWLAQAWIIQRYTYKILSFKVNAKVTWNLRIRWALQYLKGSLVIITLFFHLTVGISCTYCLDVRHLTPFRPTMLLLRQVDVQRCYLPDWKEIQKVNLAKFFITKWTVLYKKRRERQWYFIQISKAFCSNLPTAFSRVRSVSALFQQGAVACWLGSILFSAYDTIMLKYTLVA